MKLGTKTVYITRLNRPNAYTPSRMRVSLPFTKVFGGVCHE